MPLRPLLRYFLQNEQLIQKIADSPPIRRAAQLTAYMMHRSKEIGQDSIERMKESDAVKNMMSDTTPRTKSKQSFSQNFINGVKDGMKDLNKNIKKRQ